MEITKDQLKLILQKAPKGSDPKQIIKALQDKGHTIEGLQTVAQFQQQSPNIAGTLGLATTAMGKTPEQIQTAQVKQSPEYQAALTYLGGDEQKAMQAIQEPSGLQQMGTNIKESVLKGGEGVQKISAAITGDTSGLEGYRQFYGIKTPEQIDVKKLKPEERGQMFGEGMIDFSTGTLSTAFTPAAAALEAVPVVGEPAAKVIGSVIGAGGKVFSEPVKFVAEQFGIELTPEQIAYIDEGGETAASAFMAKIAEDAAKAKVLEKTKSTLQTSISDALKKGDIETVKTLLPKYEAIVSQKAPTLGGMVATMTEPISQAAGFLGKKAVELGGKGLEKGFEGIKSIIETKKGNKFIKLQDEIKTNIDSFIESNKSFSNKVNQLQKQGTDIKEVLSDPYVYQGLKVENGVVNPDMAIANVQAKIDLLMDAKSQVLPEVSKYTPKISKDILRQRALNELKTEGLTPADMKVVTNSLEKQLAALPDELSVVELDGLRASARKSSRKAGGQQKSQSEYTALENASRDLVFEATDNLLTANKGEYAVLNGQIKGLISTVEFLDKNIRGAKVKGGKLGKISGRLLGAVAGTPGGVLGSILGSELGAIISDVVMNNQLGSAFKMRLIKGLVDDPALLSQIEMLIKEVGEYQPPQLAAPTTEFKSQKPTGEVIELPSKSPSTIEMEEIQRLSSRQSDQSIPTNKTPKNSTSKTIPKSTKKVNIEKGGKNLMEWENGDLTLPELKKKLEIAIEGKEEAYLIDLIKKDITKRSKPPLTKGEIPTTTLTSKVKPDTIKGNLKPMEALLEEAKKYKSAEEFVEAQQPVYRGEYTRQQKLDNAISTSLDRKVAESFSESGKVSEMFVDKNAKIIDISDLRRDILGVNKLPDPSTLTTKQFESITGNKLIEYAKNKGYDVIDYSKAGIKSSGIKVGKTLDEVEYKVINENVLKTKSQLTDIWNKANQATPETSLTSEAKKYDSAEEFVDSLHNRDFGGKTELEQMKTVLARNFIEEQRFQLIEKPDVLKRAADDLGVVYSKDLTSFVKPPKSFADYFAGKEKLEPVTKSQLTDIWNQAKK